MSNILNTAELYQQAENAVLGALVLDAERNAALVFSAISEEDFITGASRRIFNICKEMYENQDIIDRITVKAAVGVDYAQWAHEVVEVGPSPSNCEAYIQTLKEHFARRKLLHLTEKLKDVLLYGESLRKALDIVQQMLPLFLFRKRNSKTLSQMAAEWMENMGKRRIYLDWGYDTMNRMVLADLESYIILGARPSLGKTAFALGCALNFAKKHNVTFFSLETVNKKAMDRIYAREADVRLSHIKHGELNAEEWEACIRQNPRFDKLPFSFEEAAGYTVDDIIAITHMNKSDVIIIDYIQLIEHSNKKLSEYETITYNSRRLQQLSKKGVCVIALSQLNRKEDKSPSALRGSGQLEQDADIIMMLDYPETKKMKTADLMRDYEAGRLRVLKIQKNKDGRRTEIPFWFDGSHQRFIEQWKGFYQSMAAEDMREEEQEEQTTLKQIAGQKAKGAQYGQQELSETHEH